MNPATVLTARDNAAILIIAFGSVCLAFLAVCGSVFWWIRAIARKEARKS